MGPNHASVLVLPIRVRILGLGALSLSLLAHIAAERQALFAPPPANFPSALVTLSALASQAFEVATVIHAWETHAEYAPARSGT